MWGGRWGRVGAGYREPLHACHDGPRRCSNCSITYSSILQFTPRGNSGIRYDPASRLEERVRGGSGARAKIRLSAQTFQNRKPLRGSLESSHLSAVVLTDLVQAAPKQGWCAPLGPPANRFQADFASGSIFMTSKAGPISARRVADRAVAGKNKYRIAAPVFGSIQLVCPLSGQMQT